MPLEDPNTADADTNMHCYLCWDPSLNNGVGGIDSSLSGCQEATDSTGESCLGGFCEAFATTQSHCFEAQCGQDVDPCCHPDLQAEIDAAGSRCGPVDANGVPVNIDVLDGSENMQCMVCWDIETSSMDVDRPGCSDATDAQGEPCADGYCGGFAAENGHCFEAQCVGGDGQGCPAMCMSEQAQWCGRECTPCATNPMGTTASGDSCMTCMVCMDYQQCAICGRGDDGPGREDPCAIEGANACFSEDLETTGVSDECFAIGGRIAGHFENACACEPGGVQGPPDVCPRCKQAVIGRFRQCARAGTDDAFNVRELLQGLMGVLDGVDLDALSAVLNSLDIDAIIDTIVTNGDAVDAAFGDVLQLLDVPEIADAFADGGANVETLAAAAQAAADVIGGVSSAATAASSALLIAAAATFFV